MTTQALKPISVVGTRSGNSPEMIEVPEAASQTFKKGEAVYMVSGYATEFTATVETDGSGAIRFLGFAAEDAHNDASAVANGVKVKVYVANDDTIFEGNIYHGTAASAITAVTDFDASILYPLKQLASQGDGMVAVDKEDTANHIDACQIIGFKPEHAIGDIYGRVRFIVAAAARHLRQ